MKARNIFLTLAAACMLCSCDKTPKADHVIILGFDAMSGLGIQRAHTPAFNHMIDNGAVSVHMRCVRETSSSQNWMSMVSAAPIEMHGVLGNKWKPQEVGKPGASESVAPALRYKDGFFPTIFDLIHEQKPQIRQFAYIEWSSETRMYNMDSFDESHVFKKDSTITEYRDVIRHAFADYLEKRPEMLFVSMDITDHIGHTYGHESKEYFDTITEMDSIVGEFVSELEKRGWMKNTVILVTADHGGINTWHGGDTLAEFEIPVILYGKGVTKGKVLKHTGMIYDIGATAAGLLGIELPWECRGKMLTEAFEPKDADNGCFVALPLVTPFKGLATGDITITCDTPDAKIYYTTDGTVPTEESTLYEGPFQIDDAVNIKSIAIKDGSRSMVATNHVYPGGDVAPIEYKLYRNVMDNSMPDFTKFGKADATGCVRTFSLGEFDVNDEDHFAIVMTSHLIVPKAAKYTFGLLSDDGSRLYVDGKLLMDNSNSHSAKSPLTAGIELSEGSHLIKVEYQEITKTQSLELTCGINGETLYPITPSMLSL